MKIQSKYLSIVFFQISNFKPEMENFPQCVRVRTVFVHEHTVSPNENRIHLTNKIVGDSSHPLL